MLNEEKDIHGTILYPLVDVLDEAEMLELGIEKKTGDHGNRYVGNNYVDKGGRTVNVFAVKKMHKKPKKGEWYLSGAIPEAYKAPNDLSTHYWVADLRTFQRVEHYAEVNLKGG